MSVVNLENEDKILSFENSFNYFKIKSIQIKDREILRIFNFKE